jgi:hypothetical protein
MRSLFQKAIAASHAYWPQLFLLIAIIIFFWDSFFAGKVLCLRDPSYLLLNYPQYAGRALSSNEWIPLWNPFLGHGKPYIADMESAFFYPGNWLLYFFSAGRAVVLSYTSTILITGLGMFGLIRSWKFKVIPSVCAAVALMFSTWMLAMIEFRSLAPTFAWGPVEWLVISLLMERLRVRETDGLLRNFWWIVALAATLSMQYLAGYPQMLLYTQVLIGLYIVSRCCWLRDYRGFVLIASYLFLAGVITAGICMVQFLPTWEYLPFTSRGDSIDPALNSASFHPKQLLTLIFPYLYGHPGYPQKYWGETMFEFWVGTCFVGVFPIVAASFAPFCLKKSKSEENEIHRFLLIFFGTVAALGLMLAAGKYTPLYMFCYKVIPGFSHFRWPSKFLLYLLYALIVFFALGMEQLINWKQSRHVPKAVRWLVGGWFICFLAGVVGYLFADASFFSMLTGGRFISNPENDLATLADFGRGVLFLGLGVLLVFGLYISEVGKTAWGWMALGVTFLNLWFVSREVQPIMDNDIYELVPKTLHAPFERMQPWQIYSDNQNAGQYFYGNSNRELYQWAKDAAINSILQPFGLFQEHAIGLNMVRYDAMANLLTRLDPAHRERLADLMNIRYVVGSAQAPAVLWMNASKGVQVMERPSAYAKAYLVDRWKGVGKFEEAVLAMMDNSFDPQHEVVIEPQAGQEKPFISTYAGLDAPGDVQRLRYQWNSVNMTVSAKRQALLVLTDTWFPGWKATVNGKEVPIYLGNGLFRAVPVQPGNNEVVFRYEPRSFIIGLAISLVTLVLLALAGVARVWFYFCRKRKPCGVCPNSLRKIFPR